MEVPMRNSLAVICGMFLAFAGAAAFAGDPQSQAAAPAPAAASSSSGAAASKPADPCKPPADGTVAPRKGACFSNMGSSYNAQELNATGASNPGEALRLADPSVSYHP
jgi:hypothetical protein